MLEMRGALQGAPPCQPLEMPVIAGGFKGVHNTPGSTCKVGLTSGYQKSRSSKKPKRNTDDLARGDYVLFLAYFDF